MAEGRLAIAGAVAALVACKGHREEGPPPLGKALTAVLAAANSARAPWRCAALDAPVLAAEKLGKWSTAEHTLTLADDNPELVVGIVADTGGGAPATLAALARLRTKLAGADLVVTLGGMGTTRAELEAVLGTLADHSTRPVVALPGDLEDEAEQTAAIAALRNKGDLVFDARQARWIAAGGATLATLPGAGAIERLVAGAEGCEWRAPEVAQIYDALAQKPGLRVALASESLRSGATGELPLVPAAAVDVVVHGAAPLTPARQGHRDGAKTELSPGTADASPRLPETHTPSAGLLVIRGNSWSWRPLVDGR